MITGFYAIGSTDPFNRLNKRNVRNSICHAYNCGGYALETFSWYIPKDKNGNGYVSGGFFNEFNGQRITEESVKVMLSEIHRLRVLQGPDDRISYGEYRLAFRIGKNGDFHFIKQDKQGKWWHKMGCLHIEHFPKQFVNADEWPSESGYVYSGPIVFMARNRF